MTAPTLIFTWGNPSRGDDAIGPLFAEHIAAAAQQRGEADQVECLTDFQLQIEHALDLTGRERILFVDASVAASAPFAVTALQPARDASFTSHAVSPQALLQVYNDLHGTPPASATLLAVRGSCFDLGADLSAAARRNLASALDWTFDWLGWRRAGEQDAGATAQSAEAT